MFKPWCQLGLFLDVIGKIHVFSFFTILQRQTIFCAIKFPFMGENSCQTVVHSQKKGTQMNMAELHPLKTYLFTLQR